MFHSIFNFYCANLTLLTLIVYFCVRKVPHVIVYCHLRMIMITWHAGIPNVQMMCIKTATSGRQFNISIDVASSNIWQSNSGALTCLIIHSSLP